MEIKEYIDFLFTNKGVQYINYDKGYIVVSSESGNFNFTFNIRNLIRQDDRLVLRLIYKEKFNVYDVEKKEKVELDIDSFLMDFHHCLINLGTTLKKGTK